MHLRKSWFGYLWFVVGTLLIGSYLYTQFFSLFGDLANNKWGHVYIWDIDIIYVLAACLLVVCAGLFFLISFIKKAIPKLDERVSLILQRVFFVLLFTAFLCYGCYSRFLTITFASQSGERLGISQAFINSVFIGSDSYATGTVGLLFTKIIKLFLEIFGETQIVIGYVNGIMFIVASIFAAFAAFYAFNGFCALTVFGFLMWMFNSQLLLFDITGKNLWFLFVSLFVFLAAYFLDAAKEKYEELAYFLLLLLTLSVFVCNHFLYIPYSFRGGINSAIFDYSFCDNYIVTAVVTILALFGYLSFLMADKDRISLVTLLFVALCGLFAFDFSNNNYSFVITICICVLSGFGFKNLFFEGYREKFEPVLVPLEESKPESQKEIEEITDIPVKEETISQKKVIEPEVIKEPEPIIENKPSKEAEAIKEPVPLETIKPEKPRFIENPLPVPKKHVKKTIDYAFEPSEDKMDYDIAIDDNDDFDIK